ncbi:MAG: sel1 repeat family protein, partial [Burkholderiales bacterium]|nr:sel1 repeat family protein [Burkholderiales bacterium]
MMKIYVRSLLHFLFYFTSIGASAQNTSIADYDFPRRGTLNSQGNFTGAATPERFRKKSDKNQPDQQYAIAQEFENTKGKHHDIKQAIFWYRKSADQGNLPAQMSLARIYYDGIEVTKDLAVAADWYERAANAGLVDAQFNLALMLAQGEGRAQDYQAAAGFYQMA